MNISYPGHYHRGNFFLFYFLLNTKSKKMQTIEINNQILKVGFSFRAIKNFEDLTKKTISECTTTWDNLIFFYSTVTALNPEFTATLDQFTDTLDAHPDLLTQFQTLETEIAPEQPADKQVKKKQQTKNIFLLWMLFPLFAVSPVLVPVISTILWIGASLWLLVRFTAKIGKKRD